MAALVWYWLPGGSFIIGIVDFSASPLLGGFDIPASMFVRRELPFLYAFLELIMKRSDRMCVFMTFILCRLPLSLASF